MVRPCLRNLSLEFQRLRIRPQGSSNHCVFPPIRLVRHGGVWRLPYVLGFGRCHGGPASQSISRLRKFCRDPESLRHSLAFRT
ncbi:hypothetical protein R1flu_002034 [Riccia fluitans]|uniref:Ribosomal protein S14 n=1 Tax=Riccia fluitans TaxID=41844 RepID=A0ABD1Y8V4_9MARC